MKYYKIRYNHYYNPYNLNITILRAESEKDARNKFDDEKIDEGERIYSIEEITEETAKNYYEKFKQL